MANQPENEPNTPNVQDRYKSLLDKINSNGNISISVPKIIVINVKHLVKLNRSTAIPQVKRPKQFAIEAKDPVQAKYMSSAMYICPYFLYIEFIKRTPCVVTPYTRYITKNSLDLIALAIDMSLSNIGNSSLSNLPYEEEDGLNNKQHPINCIVA